MHRLPILLTVALMVAFVACTDASDTSTTVSSDIPTTLVTPTSSLSEESIATLTTTASAAPVIIARPDLIDESVEPLDELCTTVNFSGETYHLAGAGPVNDTEGEWVYDDDGRLLVAALWTDVPCSEAETRTVELATVAWHTLTGESPEEWTSLRVVEAIGLSSSGSYQLVFWCEADGSLPATALAVVDSDTFDVEEAWSMGTNGLDEVANPKTVRCDPTLGPVLP